MEVDWKSLLNEWQDGVLLIDQNLQLCFINPAGAHILNLPAQAMLGKSMESFFTSLPGMLDRVLGCLQQSMSFTLREMEYQRREQQHGFLEISGNPICDKEGKEQGMLLLVRDISSNKLVEDDRRRYDRLDLMGTMASGLAHEIKNPLSGIRGAAQMLQRECHQEEFQDYFKMIIAEVDRLNKLIQQLLDFSKPKEKNYTSVNIHKVINSLVQLHYVAWQKKNVQVLLQLDPSLPNVYGDEDELTQAMLNFMKNAVEAMAQGGNLTIKTKLLTEYRLKDSQEKLQRMVQISVQDQGEGIAPADFAKLFAPFFTTKVGGVGLGLMISQKIIHECGGQLRLESEIGKGTKVVLLLRSLS